MFSPFGVLSKRKAEITPIIPDLGNTSEEKREYEAPGQTGAFFGPLLVFNKQTLS